MSIPQQGGGPIESERDLAEYLAAGCREPSLFRIGTEHEKFGFCKDTLKPLPYEGERSVRAVLEGFRRFGWEPILEGEHIIGLKQKGASISLEPGGQLELSGAPLINLHQTCYETHQHLAQTRTIADEIGVGFLGLGAAPTWTREQMPVMPKGRYAIMRRYMAEVGSMGLDMMFRTCTVQVNLDFSSEPDMVKKLRVGIALQPVATALFANSPFIEGRRNGFLSFRSYVWTDTDNARAGMLPFVFEDGFGFERYVQYALDVPMYFVYRDGHYHDVTGLSFRDFLAGRLRGFEGQKPTLSDWADHLTTIFPEARLKRFIEMRGADAGPWGRICALPAFWVGLLYSQSSLDAAWDIAKDWTAQERQALRDAVPREGLKATIRGRTVREIAGELLEISRAGLRARNKRGTYGDDESHFLVTLERIVETGRTPAETLIEAYEGRWGGDLTRLFREEAF